MIQTKQLLPLRYSEKEIVTRRRKILSWILTKSNTIKTTKLERVSSVDLQAMHLLYDGVFLHRWFAQNYRGKLEFSLSRRLTRSAAKVITPRNIAALPQERVRIEMRVGVDFFLNFHLVHTPHVCGIPPESSLHALMLVFEHELCHIIEVLHFGKTSCRGERFQEIARDLFGHTDGHHTLPTPERVAAAVHDIAIGDIVQFEFSGQMLQGWVANITKRATVMVWEAAGDYVDARGRRCSKYYIPLPELEKRAGYNPVRQGSPGTLSVE